MGTAVPGEQGASLAREARPVHVLATPSGVGPWSMVRAMTLSARGTDATSVPNTWKVRALTDR